VPDSGIVPGYEKMQKEIFEFENVEETELV
jgi:hypothetical protein